MEEPPDESRLDLSYLLNQAAYAFEARLADALAGHGLSVREYCVLWKAEEGERTQQEIAELAGLDKLEAAGLVERRVSDLDRRARVIGVTPRGGGLYMEAQRVVDRVTVETLRHLGAKGMHQFVQGLQRLVEDEGPLAAPSHVHPQRRKEVRRKSSATG
jgi:DNA-binding MarR family transcriptional regulator